MNDKPMPTKQRLAGDLRTLGVVNNDARLLRMAEKAREGYYDDYESPLATPIKQLVADLRAIGYEGAARQAMDGRWDCTKEESEAWANKQTDPEIRRLLRIIEGIKHRSKGDA